MKAGKVEFNQKKTAAKKKIDTTRFLNDKTNCKAGTVLYKMTTKDTNQD